MRFSDLILQEYSASKTQFSQILNDSSVKMGFECEMVSPGYDYDGDDDNDDYDPDEDEDYQTELANYEADLEEYENDEAPDFNGMTFDEMKDTAGVTISDRSQREIHRRFDEWNDKQLHDEWEVVRHSYVPAYLKRHPERDKSDAYHSWKADHAERLPHPDEDEKRDDDMDAFIRAEFNDMADFMSEFGIEWETTLERPDEPDRPERPERDRYSDRDSGSSHAEIARSLASELGVKVTTGGTRNLSTWQVISDGSIEGEGTGAEVVSGVYTLKDGLEKLEQCFNWMGNNNMETNASTGLHVSFSIDGKTSEDDYDFLKMMIFFDENYTANLFDRMKGEYAKQMRDVLFRDMKGNDPATIMASRNIGAIINTLKKMGKSLPSNLGTEKYHSFRHRANGVVEFRNMGGADYQDMFSVIRTRIANMAYVMKVGSDDSLMQRQYLSRIWAMLTTNKFKNPSLTKKPTSAPTVPYSLNAFTSIIQRSPRLMGSLTRDMPSFLKMLISEVDVATMSTLQRRQLRFAFIKNKMTAPYVRKLLSNDEKYNGLANFMRWPIIPPGEHPDEQEPLPFAQRGSDMSGTHSEPGYEHEYQDQRNDWSQTTLPNAARSITYGVHQPNGSRRR